MLKTFGRLVVVAAVAFVVLQLVRPGIPVKPASAEIQAPADVRHILEKSCYSCHSDQRRLSWFDEIVPGYWLVRQDILAAREHLDFSAIGSKPAAAQKGTLYESVTMIQLGAMPPPRFLSLHPDAKVTAEELATLKTYLAPWTNAPMPAPGQSAANQPAAPVPGEARPQVSLATVQPELDGFPFDPDFESWKPISFTDRGDNDTFRFILGNDIAVKAAQSGNISPWPNGTRFAKIAWQKESGSDGLAHPGKFVQVELMLKDAQRYKNTDGWGWGRWRGLNLEPYGKDAHFVNECTGCHLPVGGDDYVYTLPITTARVSRDEVVNNNAAALPTGLSYQPFAWRAITMYADPQSRAMATLYGNDSAIQAVKGRNADSANTANGPGYPAGAVLALVTWAQRDDPHWFGARIPNAPESVEFVQVAASGQTNTYRRFAGAGLVEDHPPANIAVQRTSFLLALAPAQMPQ
jgi:hypothetical protein